MLLLFLLRLGGRVHADGFENVVYPGEFAVRDDGLSDRGIVAIVVVFVVIVDGGLDAVIIDWGPEVAVRTGAGRFALEGV